METANYRVILKRALGSPAQGGKYQSLRGFSEKIGVSNSYLSEVLNGRKSLSVELAFKIAVKLGFTDLEAQRFCLQVQLDQESDPTFREEIRERLDSFNQSEKARDLSADLFQLIADWYHFAILELTHVAGFRPEAAYIAEKLGITRREAEQAMERLRRLELVEENKQGKMRKANSVVTSFSAVPVDAFRHFHSQLLEKANAALATQKTAERVSATDLVPLDSRQLPIVEKLSREFSSAIIKLSEKAKTKDQVYALTVHCFPITKKGP